MDITVHDEGPTSTLQINFNNSLNLHFQLKIPKNC